MRIDREWVCLGCDAPKSDLSPGVAQAIWLILAALAFAGYSYLQPNRENQPVVQSESAELPSVPARHTPLAIEQAPDTTEIEVAGERTVQTPESPPGETSSAPVVDQAPQTYEEYAASQDPAFQEQVARTAAAREAGERDAAALAQQREDELQAAAAALARR